MAVLELVLFSLEVNYIFPWRSVRLENGQGQTCTSNIFLVILSCPDEKGDSRSQRNPHLRVRSLQQVCSWDGLGMALTWAGLLGSRTWCQWPVTVCLQSSRGSGRGKAQNLITWKIFVLSRDRSMVLWNWVLKRCQEIVLLGENLSNLLSQKILWFILCLDFELVQSFAWRKLWGLD